MRTRRLLISSRIRRRRTSTTRNTTPANSNQRGRSMIEREASAVCRGFFLFGLLGTIRLFGITFWMTLPPAPRRLNDVSQIGNRRLPAQNVLNPGRVGDQSGGIAGTRRVEASANFAFGHLARAFNHFQHGIAVAGPDVQSFRASSIAKVPECKDVSIRKI